MRQQRFNRVGVTGGKPLRGDPVQSICDFARSRRGRVQRQLQHSRGERAHCRSQRATPIRCGKTGAEQSEMSEGILQQSILALELLGQFLLPRGRRRESIDGRCFFRIP